MHEAINFFQKNLLLSNMEKQAYVDKPDRILSWYNIRQRYIVQRVVFKIINWTTWALTTGQRGKTGTTVIE